MNETDWSRNSCKRLAGGLGVCFCLVLAPALSAAEQKTCEQMIEERNRISALGVEKDMAKGHEWARANLSQSDLNLIREFIEISEHIRFRCTQRAATPGKSDTAAAAPGTANRTLPAIPPLPVKRSSVITDVKPAENAPLKQQPVKGPAAAKPKAEGNS